ncbi:HYC_CC_PP family protein [Parapedobacter tibetensis]|uniref:HYC_CC_PP family protein n=1 Tax=Parapedobacter tibetensis TaxID=2972951 RepID=UPI00214D17FE|nr:hypothetical protein [Parapedobacter tibetensis]
MKKVIAILLSMTLLVSYLGFAMSTHFCGGYAVKSTLSLGNAHLNCGMATEQSGSMEGEYDNNQDHNTRFMPKPCCENQHQLLQLDDDFKVQSPSIDVNLNFIVAYVQTYIGSFLFSREAKAQQYANYSPPLLKQDTQILFQSFLI